MRVEFFLPVLDGEGEEGERDVKDMGLLKRELGVTSVFATCPTNLNAGVLENN
jgi:hypothetical protein